MITQKTKLVFVGLTLSLLLATIPTKDCLAISKSAFTTKDGYALTQEQYNKISQVYNDDVLYLQDNETITYWLQDDVEIIVGDTLYIQTDELYDTNGTYLGEYEQEISEQEATILEEKLKKKDGQPLISRDFVTLASMAAKVNLAKSSAIKPYEQITTMKKLTMSTSKNIVLTLEWLSMPKIRSFDVIAIRPGVECTFYNNNIKKNFVAYGSYQHATKNVSLAESKKYNISYEGLGKVILFDDKVKGKYDGMNGVARVYN